MLLFNCDRELARWAGMRLGMHIAEPNTSIGVVHQGIIVAVAVFNNFRHPNIEITFVTSSPRWASKGAVSAILKYPFLQLECKRVTAIIEATNQPARAFLCRLGFKLEGVHPDVFTSGEAAETYGLLRHAAQRWLVAEEKPREQTHAASPNAGRSDQGRERADHLERRHGRIPAGRQPDQYDRAERVDHL